MALARFTVVGGAALFFGGCLAGRSIPPTGDDFCVVSAVSQPTRGVVAAGDLVEADDGCLPGEYRICGHFEEAANGGREFVSEACR